MNVKTRDLEAISTDGTIGMSVDKSRIITFGKGVVHFRDFWGGAGVKDSVKWDSDDHLEDLNNM